MNISTTRIIKDIVKPRNASFLPAVALRSVVSRSGNGVYASSDTLFRSAVFGRDSLEVAEDLMSSKPKLVRSILLTLARLQGTTAAKENEEEPGKIIHEYRNVIVDGKPINHRSMEIFRALSEQWGGNETEMAYYGSVDATPHFLRVLEQYCRKHGDKILKQNITHRDGSICTLHDSALYASGWLVKKLQASRSGMLEYHRTNPHGILNQVWKDSEEFYVHIDGKRANHAGPIASIEVQGLAYDALHAAAYFNPEKSELYTSLAHTLQQLVLKKLWLDKSAYFALGTDTNNKGVVRIIQTKTANPAALLDTRLFDSLDSKSREKYIKGIVSTIMSSDFITDAGIRSRALSAAPLIAFWDYHGSYVTWPKETYDIAKGLRRQGFPNLAKQLENRLMNIYLKNRSYPEFLYVDEQGRVLSLSSSPHRHRELVVVESSNNPERVQAWTVSAIIAILDSQLISKIKPAKKVALTWQPAFEKKILAKIPKVDLYLNPFSLSARYPTYHYTLASPLKKVK